MSKVFLLERKKPLSFETKLHYKFSTIYIS